MAAELRPHFDLVVRRPPDDVMAHLSARMTETSNDWDGRVTGRHGQLTVPSTRRHLWSPWLTFEASEHEGGTLLSGRFAPHPSIWTGYMAMYGIIVFTMFGLGCFGLSQWMADEAPTMLWSLPIGTILLALLYGSAFIGQGLTLEQMQGMRGYLKGCFDDDEAEWLAARPEEHSA